LQYLEWRIDRSLPPSRSCRFRHRRGQVRHRPVREARAGALASRQARIELEAVSKRYGDFTPSRFSLSIEQGELVVLLGPSGCGKTTTLRMIAGFVPVTSGRIQLGAAT